MLLRNEALRRRLARKQGERLLIAILAACLLAVPACDREDLRSGPSIPAVEAPPPPPPPPPPCSALKVKINEWMVLNSTTLQDESANFPPWIEIYNNSDTDYNLAGVPLSDSISEPEKWKFPNVPASMLPARGYIVVFCDGDVLDVTNLHTSFAIGPGPLQLVINKGCDLVFYDATDLGTDQAAGRSPDGGPISVLEQPTPGSSNSAPAQAVAQAEFLRGDANGDGRVNVNDMIVTLKVLFQSEPPPPCEDRLDADDSGVVDLTDPLSIGAALFRNGPTIPSPFPTTGPDPTLDEVPCLEGG
jgi:lamin tail-like protein